MQAASKALLPLFWASVQRMSSKQQEQHATDQLQCSSSSSKSRQEGVSCWDTRMSITAAWPSAASGGDA
jgi:hypothetical protein